VSALTGNDWNAERGEAIVGVTRDAGLENGSLAQTAAAIRDTLVVLTMQLVFRATMLMRHLNY
jgi:hypothetical protein